MKKGQTFLIIGIFLIFLLIILVIAIAMFKPQEKLLNQYPEGQSPVLSQDFLFNVRDGQGNVINAFYAVKRSDGVIIKTGTSQTTAYEQLRNLTSNYTYELLARFNGFYSKQAPFSYNAEKITVLLDKVDPPEIRSMKLENGWNLQLIPHDEVREAVLCEAHGKNVIYFFASDEKMNRLATTNVPSDYTQKIDECVSIGTFNRQKNVFINLTTYPLEQGDYIDLLLLDRDMSAITSPFNLDYKDGENDVGVPPIWYRLNLTG